MNLPGLSLMTAPVSCGVVYQCVNCGLCGPRVIIGMLILFPSQPRGRGCGWKNKTKRRQRMPNG